VCVCICRAVGIVTMIIVRTLRRDIAKYNKIEDEVGAQSDWDWFFSFLPFLRFNGHFPAGPGWTGTRTSPFWILSDPGVMEVVAATGSIRRAKLQSNCHHQQTNTQLFTGRMSFLSPSQQCPSTEGNPLLFLCFTVCFLSFGCSS